jgi:hypothetical protein
MKTSSALLTLAFLFGTSSAALAAATPEEAQRLTALFQSYIGAEPGVVTVVPTGDSYETTIDLAPYIAKIKEPGGSVSVSPVKLTLTGQGGGKWKVDQDQSFALALKVDGKLDMKVSLGGVKGTGVFDEALGAMESSVTDYNQLALEQTVTEAGGTSKISYSIANMRYETAMTGGAGGADGTVKSTYTDLRETIAMPAQPGGMPPLEFSIASPGGSSDGEFKGLKIRAATDAVAWLVAHPSQAAIVADQATLKEKLNAMMPVFASMSGTTSLNDLSVNTMIGKFGVQRLDVLVEANGVVADGKLREKFTFSGLQMPDGVVPPWAVSLVPQNFTLDFSVADFDLAAPIKMLIDSFDLSKQPPVPPEMEQQLLQALLPKGSVTLDLGPSEIIASVFDLKAQGSMTAGPAAMPQGHATVKLKGLDAIMAAIQAAPPEMGLQQGAPMVIIAKGMAKTEGDYLTWNVESTPTGSVTINGVDPTKMGAQ